jgi:hypothetical protein
MGKKKIRAKKISKGIHSNVSSSILKAVSRGVTVIDREINKINAWRKGKNPWIQVPSGKTFIRMRANDLYGNWKNVNANLFKNDKV